MELQLLIHLCYMKKICTIIFVFLANWAMACSCATPTLLENIYRSDFIAVAKILKITQDPVNKEYHDIEVKLLDVYKGDRTTKMKISSLQGSSCAFFTPVGTTWLIFASLNDDKLLTFHYCDGSEQIDREFDLKTYPGLDQKHKNSIKLKLDVLKFFRNKKLTPADKTRLRISLPGECLKNLKGFAGDHKDFTIYEYVVNEDLSVTDVKPVRDFKNKKLAKEFVAFIENKLKNNDTTKKSIPKKIKQYLVYYFYPFEKGNESFIGALDL